MKKTGFIFGMVIAINLLGSNSLLFAMCGMPGCTHGSGDHQHEDKVDKQLTETKSAVVKESFYSTIYTCPMHPEVQQEKPGKCSKCKMKLEKKLMLMTYVCPEKECAHQKANPGKCPEHDKELVKCELKFHCPHCGVPVNPDDLKLKPVKP